MNSYINELKRRSQDKHIVIYGAGRKAQGLLCLLRSHNVEPEAFWVSHGEENRRSEAGLPIWDVHTHPVASDEVIILIGVRKRWEPEIIKVLESEGYKDYLLSPEGIEYMADSDLDRSKHTVLQITTQIGCAIDCRYCPQKLFVSRYTADPSRERSLSLEHFKSCIDQTEPEVIIDFAGFSEPFYNDACVDMIHYAHETGHPIELYTTLVGLDIERFANIREIPFREVILHLPDEKCNSKIPLTNQYMDLLQAVLETNKPDGRPFADWASCHGKIDPRIVALLDGRLRVITQLHDRAGNLKDTGLEQRGMMKGPIRCSNTEAVLHNHNVLLPDGTVLLCDSDWGMRHILGNLRKQSYDEILRGQESQRVRQLRKSEDGKVICRQCCYAVSSKQKVMEE